MTNDNFFLASSYELHNSTLYLHCGATLMSCQQKRVPNHLPRPVLSVAERKEGEEFIFALTITEGEEEELLTPYGLALRDNIGVQGLDKEFVRKVKLIGGRPPTLPPGNGSICQISPSTNDSTLDEV